MRIINIQIAGYRSIRDVSSPLERVTVLVGPNGVGKSNLYRSLQLLQQAAGFQLARAIAEEGGIESVFWAGTHKLQTPNTLTIRIEWETCQYEAQLGITKPTDFTHFPRDPYVRTETIATRSNERWIKLIERAGPQLRFRERDGNWATYPKMLACYESLLVQIREPERFPEVLEVRDEFAAWRFFHTFRTDPDSPLRKPQVVFRTPWLDGDGGNLAATLMSIQEGRYANQLQQVVARAFPDSALAIQNAGASLREVGLRFPGLNRVLTGFELSDGTLRFLCLAAALLSSEPPPLIVLNEPESSLHASTYPALAELISLAAEHSQVLVVTHSPEFAAAIALLCPTRVRALLWNAKFGTRMDHQLPVEQATKLPTEEG